MARKGGDGAHGGRRERMRGFLVFLVICLVTVGCEAVTADDLFQVLPPSVNGIPVVRDRTTVDTQSGLEVDSVLAALSKTRADAAWVAASVGDQIGVNVLAVQGVAGPDLTRAVVASWDQAAVVDRNAATVATFPVTVMREVDGDTLFVYGRRDVVFVVSLPVGRDQELVSALLSGIEARDS